MTSLLEGPRGRHLCLEIAKELDPDVSNAAFWLSYDLDPDKSLSMTYAHGSGDSYRSRPRPSVQELADQLAEVDVSAIGYELIESALERSVDTARYWQEPDGEDVLTALPEVRAALAPIAEHIMALPAVQWWAEPRAVVQWVVEWRSDEDPARLTRDPGQTLARWGHDVRAEEEGALSERPRNPRANISGAWWSIALGLVQTVGRIPGSFNLVEDSLGWEYATAIPVRGSGRTFEIRTADDWVALCRTYPLDVTASRRHDWFRTTGRDGRWVIPDWERAAHDWDAVHLSVLAYLSSATRALTIDAGTATVIAGWDPDTTIWLADVVHEFEEPRQSWNRAANDGAWTRVA